MRSVSSASTAAGKLPNGKKSPGDMYPVCVQRMSILYPSERQKLRCRGQKQKSIRAETEAKGQRKVANGTEAEKTGLSRGVEGSGKWGRGGGEGQRKQPSWSWIQVLAWN